MTRHEYTVPEGTIYIEIKAAQNGRPRYAEESDGPFGYVAVSTNPEGPHREPKGFLTIRGRQYRVSQYYRWYPSTWKSTTDFHWDRQATYGRIENEHGKEIDWRLKTIGTINRLVADALADFLDHHPAWFTLSRRMYYQRELDDVDTQITNGRNHLKSLAEKRDQLAMAVALLDA